MGVLKRPMNRISYKVKAKGSKELATKLLKGDLKRISDGLNISYNTVVNVIYGRQFGDSRIIECAEKMVSFYQGLDIEFNVNKIIENHATINQD